MTSYRFLKGLTLLEMAIVLAVLGVLVAGGIASLPEQRVVAKQLESQAIQANIKEQLMKFILINRYLPCPDIDTPLDGRENRTPVNVGGDIIDTCSSDTGAVPYLDIGLRIEDVQDAYGNFIRYAVNQDADDQVNVVICDDTSSASYFCNAVANPLNANRAVFTLVDTPPTQGNTGAGNYRICNANVNVCNNGTAATDLQSDGVSVVLVAYNEDGAQILNLALSNNCNAAGGANTENCNQDAFYHQQAITTQENNFFDDTIVTISGYEIKSKILSPVTVWINSIQTPALPSTLEGYNLEAGDYAPMDDENTPDVIRVNRNITVALNLGAGNDQVVVGNDLSSELEYNNNTGEITDKGTQAALDTGEGDDTVYIVGAANSNVTLGEGDDSFVLGTNLTETLSAGSGNDKIWIQGNVESTATFTLGDGDDVVWLGGKENYVSGNLDAPINGGAGYDILVLENMTKAVWQADSFFQSRVDGFELVIFKGTESGTREHLTL